MFTPTADVGVLTWILLAMAVVMVLGTVVGLLVSPKR